MPLTLSLCLVSRFPKFPKQDKARKFANEQNPNLPPIPLALLAYPVLQAADILLYR